MYSTRYKINMQTSPQNYGVNTQLKRRKLPIFGAENYGYVKVYVDNKNYFRAKWCPLPRFSCTPMSRGGMYYSCLSIKLHAPRIMVPH